MRLLSLFDRRGRYAQVDGPARYNPVASYLCSKKPRAAFLIAGILIAAVVVVFGLVGVGPASPLSLSSSSERARARWIEQTMAAHIDDPVDMTALTKKCDAMTWNKGLVLKCHEVIGGVGNVRNKMLNCIRFAMEAGAGLILPNIIERSTDDLSNLVTNVERDFDYMFDSGVTVKRLHKYCPQLPLYKNLDDFEAHTAAPYTTLISNFFQYGNSFDDWNLFQLSRLETWADDLLQDVAEKTGQAVSPSHPVLVDIGGPLFAWRMQNESFAFQYALGRTIESNKPIYDVAGSILFVISQRMYALGITSNTDPLTDINPHGFFGAHLRTAEDATAVHWMGYREQSRTYIAEALRRNLTYIYVSSGSPSDIVRFRHDAGRRGLRVVSKADLLPQQTFEALRATLTWDQMALIDHAVLLRSAFFMGIDASTFAVKIGLTRRGNARSGVHGVVMGQGVLSTHPNGTIGDELSRVVGSPGALRWTTDGMWP